MSTVVAEVDVVAGPGRELVGSPDLLDWVRALGIDPAYCRGLRVLADGDGSVEFTCYQHRPGQPRILADDGRSALTYTTTRPLTAPIPPAVLAAGRRS